MKTPFKHRSSFESAIAASCVEGSCKPFGISKASLDHLRPLIPPEVDLTKNIDLLGVAFNAAVVNKFNKNGDGIDTKTAIAIKDYFINKPTNIEHQKGKVVGHIISSSFSDYGTNELLDDESVESLDSPFNIALGALVYKVVNPSFARMLEQTDEGEEFYNTISASWEIGFNDYCIALGSDDLSEAELITDKNQIKEFSKYLKAYDGDGEMDDGTLVHRLVIGEIYPLGIGFTTNPAADVKGVAVENEKEIHIKQEDYAIQETEITTTPKADIQEGIKKMKKNSSLSREKDVNKTNALIMDTKDLLKQIEGMLSEKVGDSQHFEEAVASVSKVMIEAIKEKDELWQQAKEAKDNAEAEATIRHNALSTEVDGLREKLVATESQLEELAEEKHLREAKDLFNSRMASITEAFELGQEDLRIVASELSELDGAAEAFASYQEKVEIMWQHKTKAYLEAQEEKFNAQLEEEVQKRLSELSESTASEASAEESAEAIEDVLDNVGEETSAALPNNNEASSVEEQSLREKFNKAFSKENITIKY